MAEIQWAALPRHKCVCKKADPVELMSGVFVREEAAPFVHRICDERNVVNPGYILGYGVGHDAAI